MKAVLILALVALVAGCNPPNQAYDGGYRPPPPLILSSSPDFGANQRQPMTCVRNGAYLNCF